MVQKMLPAPVRRGAAASFRSQGQTRGANAVQIL